MKTVIGSGNFPIVIKDEGDLAAHVEAGATSVSVAMPAENNPSAIEEEAPLSSSSESTSGSEMEETTYEPHAEVWKFQPPFAPDGSCMWQHRKSRILHLMSVDHQKTFVCGIEARVLFIRRRA